MSKVILITGASNGIGKATAEKLVSDGHKVYGADISFDSFQNLEEQGVRCLKMDVTNEEQVIEGVKKIIDHHGKIDGLFANAGRASLGMTELVSMEEVMSLYDVNVFGVLRCVKAVLPFMRNAAPNGKGRIIITSSNFGSIALPGLSTYSSSKFGLEALATALRHEMELLFPGINLITIEPGHIKTELYRSSLNNWLKAMTHPEANAYETAMKNLFKEFNSTYRNGDSVEKVSDIVSHAFLTDNPKNRYACGKQVQVSI